MTKIKTHQKNDVSTIISLLETLGFQGVSDPSSQNQIYTKNGDSIVIRKNESK